MHSINTPFTLISDFCQIGIKVIHICQTLCALFFEKKKRPVGNSWTFLSKSGRKKKNVLLSKCRRFFSKSGRIIRRRLLIESTDHDGPISLT